MAGRVKFQVWGRHGWATAYVVPSALSRNIELFVSYGFKVRAGGLVYQMVEAPL